MVGKLIMKKICLMLIATIFFNCTSESSKIQILEEQLERNQKELEEFAINLKKQSPSFQNVTILGPAPAPMYFLRGKYRYRFLIKSIK